MNQQCFYKNLHILFISYFKEMEGMKCFAQMFSTVYGRLENLGKQTNISRGIKKTFRAFSITDVFFQIYLTLCLYPTNINLKKKTIRWIQSISNLSRLHKSVTFIENLIDHFSFLIEKLGYLLLFRHANCWKLGL